MPTPTEPGHYWFRVSEKDNWRVVYLVDGGQLTHAIAIPGVKGTFELPSDKGEWGERIPDNDTLRKARERQHTPAECGDAECPWLRAQEEPHA